MPLTSTAELDARSDRSSPISVNDKIDICRGLFAFVIVTTHALDIAAATSTDAVVPCARLLDEMVRCARFIGSHCVIGFFVISGYCIQLSVSRLNSEQVFPISRYLAARLSRILPLYYFALIFTICAEWLISGTRPNCWQDGLSGQVVLGQLLLIQNLTQTFGCFTASWSITNEMFYYLFYGVLVFIAFGRGIRSSTLGMLVCIAIALPLDAIYVAIYRSHFIYNLGMLFGMGTFWFLGAIVADRHKFLKRSRSASLASRLWPVILTVACAVSYSERFHPQVAMIMVALGFALMLVRFVSRDADSSARRAQGVPGRWIEMLGLASYPTYLFHGPLLFLVASALLRWNLADDWRITWIVLVTFGILSGILLGEIAERPMMQWRAAYLKRIGRPRASAAKAGMTVGIVGASR